MPFNTAGSVISTDLDNMVRGLNRDNSDTVLTNTTNETAVKSFTIPANVIGPTGGFHLRVCGTEAGTNSTKTIKLKFGSTLIATILDLDRKSTRLNSSHSQISYAVFCLKKKQRFS